MLYDLNILYRTQMRYSLRLFKNQSYIIVLQQLHATFLKLIFISYYLLTNECYDVYIEWI